ncbi:MAG: lipo-like protein [Pseudomonadales bacterium]|nr:lipo-like protein [Pseudomonadales bacterium]
MLKITRSIGSYLASFLSKPRPGYQQHDTAIIERVVQVIRPGDILLVDGNSRISTAIKYLTQSTWSHACLYMGDDARTLHTPSLVEADLNAGVTLVPLSKYASYNVRICRPVGLSDEEREQLLSFVRERLGYRYDLKNIFDLMRYLIQNPAVPTRYRRQMLSLGSGEPTKAICSTLIAQAFQSINYPILPRERLQEESGETHLEQRHYTHYVPRDFDLSPYFCVIKPTLELGFDFHSLRWVEPVPLAPIPPRQRVRHRA